MVNDKFYSLYITTVVGIFSRHELSIDVHHENPRNKSKLALYKLSIHFNSRLVTPKSVPPKIGPAGPILAENFAKISPPGPLLLPKSVQPDQFW